MHHTTDVSLFFHSIACWSYYDNSMGNSCGQRLRHRFRRWDTKVCAYITVDLKSDAIS
jgi:hypothetical protein